MGYLNRVTFMGNVGSHSELRKTNTGVNVINFSLVMNESFTDNHTKERKVTTTWIDCAAFGVLAIDLNRLISKGVNIYIEGKLRTAEKNGVEYKKVVVENFQFFKSTKAG